MTKKDFFKILAMNKSDVKNLSVEIRTTQDGFGSPLKIDIGLKSFNIIKFPRVIKTYHWFGYQSKLIQLQTFSIKYNSSTDERSSFNNRFDRSIIKYTKWLKEYNDEHINENYRTNKQRK